MSDEDVLSDIEQARLDRRRQLQRIQEMDEEELLRLENLLAPNEEDDQLEVDDRKAKLTEEEWDFIRALHPSAWSRIKRRLHRG